MRTAWKLVIIFAVIILVFLVGYNFLIKEKTLEYYNNRNRLCFEIANELRNNPAETNCTDYYCYYAPYKPPKELENKTETLCICDCKTENGTIISSQILNVNTNK